MVEISNQALGPVLVKATLFGSSTIVSGCLPPKNVACARLSDSIVRTY